MNSLRANKLITLSAHPNLHLPSFLYMVYQQNSGGSTALWSGGYRVGPGRNIPNALLFVGR